MKKRIFIEGTNVYLRPLDEEDIMNNYIHWFDDNDACKMNSHHKFPYSKKMLIDYVESVGSSNSELVLAIIEKNNDIHIGNISLQYINYINRNAEFAIFMGEKSYWGRGYSTEAGRLLIEHGFKSLNLYKVYCATYSENIGMIKLAENLGFSQEGVRKEQEFKNGKYIDVLEYGLLKSNWEKGII